MEIFSYLKYFPGFIAIILLLLIVMKALLIKKIAAYLKKRIYLYLIPFFLIMLLLVTFYLLARATLAQYYFRKSLRSDSTAEIYNYQRLSIITNPNIAEYRIRFSQTNLLIANNIAQKGIELKTDNRQPTDQLSAQDRQIMTQAIRAAIEEAKAAVKLNDQKASNWENLGNIYRNLINMAQDADAWAISSYQRAIVLEPENPNHRLNLGGIYYLLKNYDEAIRLFEQAAALKPDWPNPHYNLAWALSQKKDYQRAALEMQTAISLLDPKKDSTDLKKAQKDLDEFKLKLSEETSL